MVGEEGPEMVHLPVGTHIYNRSETESMLSRNKRGNTQINVNLTLNAPVLGSSSHSSPRSRREYLEMLAPALQDALAGAM
jgi:hypothetical protein